MILKTDAYLYLVNFNAIKIEKFDYNLPHNRGYVRASINALGRNKALPVSCTRGTLWVLRIRDLTFAR